MIIKPDCVVCSINGVINLFKNGLVDPKYQEEVLRKVLKFYAETDYNSMTIDAARNIQKIVREVAGIADPYKTLKDKYNHKALEYSKKYRDIVKNAPNPLEKAMRLAIAGNIIDFGPTHDFDVEIKIQEVFEHDFPIYDAEELFSEIKKAGSILYLGDNTGEIVFDKLFLEVIDHPNVTFAVRHSPVLNDATMEDAVFADIDKVAKVITNGDNVPGTFLNSVSKEFMEHFNNADLIISKGQGNFEGLSGITDKNIYFLLTVKCEQVARELGVKKGDCVVKSALKSLSAK